MAYTSLQLLADICPGDLNTFMFPSTGAEANETAVRMARVMTGRHKVGADVGLSL